MMNKSNSKHLCACLEILQGTKYGKLNCSVEFLVTLAGENVYQLEAHGKHFPDQTKK